MSSIDGSGASMIRIRFNELRLEVLWTYGDGTAKPRVQERTNMSFFYIPQIIYIDENAYFYRKEGTADIIYLYSHMFKPVVNP